VTLPDTTTVNYAYDYQNRLVSRTQGGEVRTFLFGSGNQVLEETLNGSRLALYGWGADGLASRTDANGQTLFYLKDALGSVMAIVDGRGAVVQSYEFSAYGESLSGKDAVNAFRFVGGAGGYTDDATGLVQFWNRWYDPQVGKWVSEDPIRQRGGVNLYGYVGNGPTEMVDFEGLRYIRIKFENGSPVDYGTGEPIPSNRLNVKTDPNTGEFTYYKNTTDDTYYLIELKYELQMQIDFRTHTEWSAPKVPGRYDWLKDLINGRERCPSVPGGPVKG
jgi:RHS repeat-associated protein